MRSCRRVHGAGRQGRRKRRGGRGSGRALPHRTGPPPHACVEWFGPVPGSLCSPHAGPRWRRRWRPRSCDHKEGAGARTGARRRRRRLRPRPRPGPLPSASRPPSYTPAPPPPAAPRPSPNRPTSMVRLPRAPTWGRSWS